MTAYRRPVYFNPTAQSWSAETGKSIGLANEFHHNLWGLQKSPLLSLESVAAELGVGAVYVKDETSRQGQPAILGASWGVFRAVTDRLGLPLDTNIEIVKARLSEHPIPLYAAAYKSYGSAMARMGCLLAVPVEIHVPAGSCTGSIASIQKEGASVVESKGDFYTAIKEAQVAAEHNEGLLVQDVAFDGYEDIPQYIAEGYSTMMREIDDQLPEQKIDLVVCPIGTGSLAQAAVTNCKIGGRSTGFMAVEPDIAGCLWNSLAGEKTMIDSKTPTIVAELGCGTVSKAAWEPLKSGTDASLTISDYEAHLARLDLQECGIAAGPAGASSLAALRRLDESGKAQLGLNHESVVVLLCTESTTSYPIPRDVAHNDVVSLTQTLIQIDSSVSGSVGPGETSIAQYITAWLQHRNIECHWIEETAGRPSVIGVVRGSGDGKSLMFNGHIDTVTLQGYNGDPLSGKIVDGNIYGRGAADMKSGLAAAMVALVAAKGLSFRGDVILAAVADEEADSIGTEQVLRAGWRADAAIVAEPTELAVINSHKGYALFEVDIYGVASHGSRPDLGIDAICKAGYFLVELDRYAQEIQNRYDQSDNGAPNIHAGLIKGGEEINSYPARCTVSIERRTIAGETSETVRAELLQILEKIAATVPNFMFGFRTTSYRSPYSIDRNHSFVNLIREHATKSMGTTPPVRGETYWTDMALLSDVGIPGVIWGPTGYGLHAKTEWVEIESVRQLAESFIAIEADFCK